MADTNQGQALGHQQQAAKGQGHRPGVKDTAAYNYFRFVWDDDEEADDVPTPPAHRKDYPEPPALPPDIIPEVHSGIARAPNHGHNNVPKLEAPPSHPNPHRSPTRPTTTSTDTLTINNNLYNLSGGGGQLYGKAPNGPKVGTGRGLSDWGEDGSNRAGRSEVVLGVQTADAAFSSSTTTKDHVGYLPEDDTHPRVTYPALEGVGGGDKGAAGVPTLEYPGRKRPRCSYESSGIKRPLSPLRVKPNSIVSDVETTHVSLLSDDENILAADDASISSPFTPDHSAILSPPTGGGLNKSKRRRMIIWALIICAAMVIAGLVTYLSIRAIRGW